jgi:ubiquitin C-terminal hydrolase
LSRISHGVPTTGGQAFSNGGQHDTTEFFNAILATLKDTISLPSVSGIVSQTFQGFNKNVKPCGNCSYKFVNMESNMCLSLPVVRVDGESSETTIEKCIESYLEVWSMSL